jgi:hypothetical protein
VSFVSRRQLAKPMRWLSAMRGVSFVCRASRATSGSAQYGAIGSSSESFPAAARRTTSSAKTGFVSDAALYSVHPVAGTPSACSPYARVHAIAPFLTYAIEMLGT